MKNILRSVAVALVCAVIPVGASAQMGEEITEHIPLVGSDSNDMPISALPEQVVQAARTAVPGIALIDADKEVHDGQTVYEIDGELDGEEYEIEVSADGTVLELEGGEGADADDDADRDEDVALNDVPQVVLDAARAAVPGLEPDSAEREEEDGRILYEIKGTVGTDKHEVEVWQDGTVHEVD